MFNYTEYEDESIMRNKSSRNFETESSPPGMRRRSDVSFRFHIGWDVADHADTSTWHRIWYVNETDLFITSLRRLVGT